MSPEEYFAQLLPLGGGPGTVSKVTLALVPTPTSMDMRTLFGNYDNGSHFMFKADGPQATPPTGTAQWRAYFSLTPKAGTIAAAGALFPAASGFQAWPLLDGQEKLGKALSGKAIVNDTSKFPTGFATMLDHRILNVMCNIGSGLLHVQRLTLPQGMDAAALRPPVASGIFPPGPSGWFPPYP